MLQTSRKAGQFGGGDFLARGYFFPPNMTGLRWAGAQDGFGDAHSICGGGDDAAGVSGTFSGGIEVLDAGAFERAGITRDAHGSGAARLSGSEHGVFQQETGQAFLNAGHGFF